MYNCFNLHLIVYHVFYIWSPRLWQQSTVPGNPHQPPQSGTQGETGSWTSFHSLPCPPVNKTIQDITVLYQ